MLFSTFDYFLFLPMVAVAHWLVRDSRVQTWIILVASAIFYLAWNPLDSLVLLGVGTAAFFFGRWMHGIEKKTPLAWAAAAVILGPLFFYKYVHFLGENIHALWPAFPVLPRQHLPIGISFYSFQALAYVLDVRRGEKPEPSPVKFATFLCFFPHLVAGPILRASNLLGQLAAERNITRDDVGQGLWRIGVGLAKKLLIADVLRVGMIDSVFTDPAQFTGLEVLVALYAYTLQIYADFSGYTDFAIGSSRLLGFRIPENFNRPYQALSVANYWRRWHITLSDWVRDYVYYPMGGSRGGGWIPYRNTMATLLILGAWHGANWTFVVYGVLHGVAVGLNRWWKKRPGWTEPTGVGVAWRWLLTFQFVVLARILFRSDDLAHAGTVTGALLSRWSLDLPRFSPHAWAVLALGYAAHFTPVGWAHALRDQFLKLPAVAWGLALAGLGWLCTWLGVGDSLAFIYYAF